MGNFVNDVFMKLGLLLSVTCRHRSSGIIEVVLGTEISDYDRQTGDNKTRPKNWCRQFARKVAPRANSDRYSSFRL